MTTQPNAVPSVFILIGPKGCGKTTIGSLLEREFGIPFLRVEPLILENMKTSPLTGYELEKEGFHLEEQAIASIVAAENAVIFEATGSSRYFPEVLARLRRQYDVRLIRIRCPLELCSERVAQRDAAEHIAVSDELLESINRRAAGVELDWDLEIDNSGPAPDEQIVSLFRTIV